MATSSIFADIEIKTIEEAESLIAAIEESKKDLKRAEKKERKEKKRKAIEALREARVGTYLDIDTLGHMLCFKCREAQNGRCWDCPRQDYIDHYEEMTKLLGLRED